MKLSDKALWQIGRKLLARADAAPLRDSTAPAEKQTTQPRNTQPWRFARKQRKAAVLTFKKRHS